MHGRSAAAHCGPVTLENRVLAIPVWHIPSRVLGFGSGGGPHGPAGDQTRDPRSNAAVLDCPLSPRPVLQVHTYVLQERFCLKGLQNLGIGPQFLPGLQVAREQGRALPTIYLA